jgi:hypothetical protein
VASSFAAGDDISACPVVDGRGRDVEEFGDFACPQDFGTCDRGRPGVSSHADQGGAGVQVAHILARRADALELATGDSPRGRVPVDHVGGWQGSRCSGQPARLSPCGQALEVAGVGARRGKGAEVATSHGLALAEPSPGDVVSLTNGIRASRPSQGTRTIRPGSTCPTSAAWLSPTHRLRSTHFVGSFYGTSTVLSQPADRKNRRFPGHGPDRSRDRLAPGAHRRVRRNDAPVRALLVGP